MPHNYYKLNHEPLTWWDIAFAIGAMLLFTFILWSITEYINCSDKHDNYTNWNKTRGQQLKKRKPKSWRNESIDDS